ncbi:DUF305 domain-containing protein [Kineococcus sp. NUM-3379]
MTTTSTTHATARRLGALTAAAGLSLVLAACGGGDSGSGGHDMGSMGSSATPSASAGSPATEAAPGAPAAGHNNVDTAFAQDMIVHHEGAVEMASLAAERAGSQQVKDLALEIIAAQGPEIEQMSGWLESWGEPVEAAGEHSAHGGGMPGMMSEEEMGAMEDASGAEFDRMFLEGMIEHHRGAVDMARTEQAEGADPDAKALAATIEADQTREIAEMQRLLRNL